MKNKATALYIITVFLGAFCIFQVQPLLSKFILPWFGGTPAVWTVCMLFFQSLLFGGYLYAHVLSTKAGRGAQFFVHCLLLIASATLVLVRTILPSGMQPGPDAQPIIHILFVLTVAIGLPFFALAATSPLLQFWYGRSKPGGEPYVLYSVSNIGSLLALVMYPVLFEPLLPLRIQSIAWSICFAVFVFGCIAVAWLSTLRKRALSGASESDYEAREQEAQPEKIAGKKAGGKKTEKPQSRKGERLPGKLDKFLWLSLPALSSVLLLAVTNQLCTDVASGPLLWVLPLSIYLLSFALAFTGWSFVYNRMIFFCVLVSGFALVAYMLLDTSDFSFPVQIIAYSIVLFFGCTALHSELYLKRPPGDILTRYYLFISCGGAFGGIFAGIIAPLVFSNFYELHLSGIAVLASIIVIACMDRDFMRETRTGNRKRIAAIIFAVLLSAGVGSAFLYQVLYKLEVTREQRRSFFGVVHVQEGNREIPLLHDFRLVHGTTYHGVQFTDSSRRKIPTAYYSYGSGAGLALREYPRTASLDIAAVGLGIGTIAAYAWPGDRYRFYEINEDVIELAQDGRYFHYIEDARIKGAIIEIVPGDARLSMEAEAKRGIRQAYDIIVLDAFSSDAIPIHLLTREAFGVYFGLLKKDGVIACHITNRNLDLSPVISASASRHNTHAIFLRNEPVQESRAAESEWVLLTNNSYFVDKYYTGRLPGKKTEWTDDFSNLFGILK